MIDMYVSSRRVGWAIDGKCQEWFKVDDIATAIDRCCASARLSVGSRWYWMRVRTWISGALARPFSVGPIAGVARWSDVQAIADATAPRATDLDGPLRVVPERSWPDVRAIVATASPVVLLDALEESTRRHRLKSLCVRPLWALALEQVLDERPEVQVVVVDESDAWTVLGTEDGIEGGRSSMRLATHAAPVDLDAARAFRNRLLMSHDVGRDQAVSVVPRFDDGAVSQPWPFMTLSTWDSES